MADQLKFIALAKRLIAKNGRVIQVCKIDPIAVDPSMPWKGSNSTYLAFTSTPAVFIPAAGSKFGSDWMDTELLKDCEQICLIAGGGIDITEQNILRDIDNTDWKINLVSRLQPSTLAILYMVGVSR